MSKLTVGQKVGAKLKKLIKKKNLTQEQFAEQFGTTSRTVRRWIKDYPSLSTLEQLSKFFGIPITDFFEEE